MNWSVGEGGGGAGGAEIAICSRFVAFFEVFAESDISFQKKNKAGPPIGERVANKKVEIWNLSPTKDRQVRFAVDMNVCAEPTAEPTKQDTTHHLPKT